MPMLAGGVFGLRLTYPAARLYHRAQTPLRAKYGDGVGIDKAREAAAHRAPRFYYEDDLLARKPGSVVKLEGKEATHAVKSLRLRPGDKMELCDGKGCTLSGQLVSLDRNSALVEAVEEAQQTLWEGPRWEVVAACSTLKGGRADWLVEKASELGAFSLQPLLTERSSAGTRGGRDDRWSRVAQAASKQSLRPFCLDVRAPISVSGILPRVRAAPMALLASAGARPLREVLGKGVFRSGQGDGENLDEAAPWLLIVGPEGDFTAEEVDLLLGAGCTPVGLGSLRLRAETAAIALLSAVMLMAE